MQDTEISVLSYLVSTNVLAVFRISQGTQKLNVTPDYKSFL